MKKILVSLFAVAVLPSFCTAQPIALWTFESTIPTGAGPHSPEVGAGSATGFHAGTTTYNNPVGNGSVESFSANNWVVGDYYQFQVSTLGFSDITVSFDQVSSGTGPGEFNFQYSTDGSSFTTFGSTYVVLVNAAPNPVWNATTRLSLYTYTMDLSSVTDLNNQSAVYFRLTAASDVSAAGGTVAGTGATRVDNFLVVPEPSTAVLAGFGGLLLMNFLRRRR